MKRLLTLAALLVPMAQAADVTGEWSIRLIRFNESFAAARVQLQTNGNHVTGTLNELKLEGTLNDNHLHLEAKRPNGKPWGALDGEVRGDEMSGAVKQGGEEFQWAARKIQRTASQPQTHVFEPKQFQRVFSGAILPALRIRPGDTVQTSTVDAGGVDAGGIRRSLGGNPETGPFYVEGAMPDDTLAVRFVKVRLNRDSAGSGNRIVPSALDPDYYRDAKYNDNFDSEWKLDRAAGTATLAKPTERLKNFRVKLDPMVGCVGVAPPSNQTFRSGWLGSWGGNLDFHGIGEGTTVYLPVYQEGAILFVGDGHALEGDGELNGDALETSMDLEFTVNLIRGESTHGPRFENNEFLMTSGIAGSLSDALQQATGELARWLEKGYKLSANESNVVLGTSIRYEIAEVVDPQVHIVAKISKQVLAGLK